MLLLYFYLFQEKLNKIILFGAGLLVGTALAVIIPEGKSNNNVKKPIFNQRYLGVRSMISEQNIPTHAHNESANSAEPSDSLSVIGISLVFGFVFMLVVDQVFQ